MTDTLLDPGWTAALRGEFDAPYMATLRAFVAAEEAAGKRIFPPAAERFAALALTPLEAVRIVILGQDPYHGAGQAHGLSFSVRPGVKVPPSLANIYKELASDCGVEAPAHGHLAHWARQGVLLLNTVLTVEEGRAAAHRDRGWERFTDAVVRAVAEKEQPVVFLLWGSHAQKKAAFVRDVSAGGRHLVLTAPHPSPLSAYKGWFGSRHFSRANTFLAQHGRGTIDWALPAVEGGGS